MRISITATFEMNRSINTDDYPDDDWSFFDPDDPDTWPGTMWELINSEDAYLTDWSIIA